MDRDTARKNITLAMVYDDIDRRRIADRMHVSVARVGYRLLRMSERGRDIEWFAVALGLPEAVLRLGSADFVRYLANRDDLEKRNKDKEL